MWRVRRDREVASRGARRRGARSAVASARAVRLSRTARRSSRRARSRAGTCAPAGACRACCMALKPVGQPLEPPTCRCRAAVSFSIRTLLPTTFCESARLLPLLTHPGRVVCGLAFAYRHPSPVEYSYGGPFVQNQGRRQRQRRRRRKPATADPGAFAKWLLAARVAVVATSGIMDWAVGRAIDRAVQRAWATDWWVERGAVMVEGKRDHLLRPHALGLLLLRFARLQKACPPRGASEVWNNQLTILACREVAKERLVHVRRQHEAVRAGEWICVWPWCLKLQ